MKVKFSNAAAPAFCLIFAVFLGGCKTVVKAPYEVTKTAVKASVWTVKTGCEVAAGTTKAVYKAGKFTFRVVMAPLSWPLTHKEIESIGGLPPKEAIRLGKVKTSPYVVDGRTYRPMGLNDARDYSQTGLASWYGYETLRQNRGAMTADGEVFDPRGLTAAHKYLPLPCFVKVTNLENGRSIIVRVNDRGPFPSGLNPSAGKRIIDLSMGAAEKLGFHSKGLAMVRVQTVASQ
ncbi:MAG: septal ring lytic transglycosylase RlpA family protein [Nitrospiraceae bacterium]|nr:septal ring lytic transglycosylase RlpA family protein [Nitrospiraceae bacterium]